MDFVPLGKLLTESKIESKTPDPDRRIRVKLNVKGVEKRPLIKSIKGATKYFIRKKGQFIYGKQNLFKGAFGIVPEELDGFESTSDIPAFDVDNSCNPEWIYYCLKHNNFFESLVKYATGTGSRRIHPKKLFKEEIPLPSRDIQDKIIIRFKLHEGYSNKLLNNIKFNNNYISKLRQAILSEAIQGKLVPQDPNDESASVLLEKIKSEKPNLMKLKKIRKDKPFKHLDESEFPYPLHSNWKWVRFNDIVALRRGASPRPIKNFITTSNEGVNWIKIGDTGNSKYVTSTNERVTQAGAERSVFVSKGELIMSNSMSFGRPYILKIDGCIHDGWLSISFSTDLLDIDFLYYLLSAQQAYYEEMAKGTGARNLNINKVAEMPVPLPPLNEQKRIVEKIDQLMQLCDQLESQVKENQKNSEALMNSVLREAFEI